MSIQTSDLVPWLVLWALLVGFLILFLWRRSALGVGLTFAYVANFAVLHWFGALVHALPWSPFYDVTNTFLGFRECSIGFMAFVFSSAFVAPMFSVRAPKPQDLPAPALATRVAWAYLYAGLAFWLLSYTPLSRLPTITAVIFVGRQMLLVGICLHAWMAWQQKDRMRIRLWLLSAGAFPVVTVLAEGFLGFGVAAIIMTCAFVASFYRPRWRVLVLGLVGVYLGLSLFVAYAVGRQEIRESVWGGQTLESRVLSVRRAFFDFSLIDLRDETHLQWIDRRLNQNELVGAAIRHTPENQDFARGSTFVEAVLALVPRVLWPDKPVQAGSGDLVTRFTGISFGAGTSVGVGQTLEFYVNFGRSGVITGFLIFGIIVTLIDRIASRRLRSGDWYGFGFWFLVGIGAMQVGGSLVEVTSSMGAAAATAWGLNVWLRRRALREERRQLQRQRA